MLCNIPARMLGCDRTCSIHRSHVHVADCPCQGQATAWGAASESRCLWSSIVFVACSAGICVMKCHFMYSSHVKNLISQENDGPQKVGAGL